MQLKSQLLLVPVAVFFVAGALGSTPMNAGTRDQEATITAPSDSAVVGPRAIKKVQPIYPDDVARRGIEATIYLSVLIDEEGYVVKAAVDTARTFFSHPGEHKTAKYEAELAQAARDAIMQWKFKPGTINGKPSAMGVLVPIQFQIADMQGGAQGTLPSTFVPPPIDLSPRQTTDENGKPLKSGEPDKK
jgi:hypothetical protein